MVAKLPIIYVRGYAGSTSGIDKAADDPFYGFNLGSTHVRVGGSGEPTFYQFESPLLRLILEEGYQLKVKGSQEQFLDQQEDGAVSPQTIWIHRFYDVSASTYAEKPQDFSLESAAQDLLRLVEKVRTKTGAPRVNLVAHSMGGLICRCLLQKIIPEAYDGSAGTERKRAIDFVERLFTYGTPHGGIEFDVGFGMIERIRDSIGFAGGDIFGPGRMYEYLTPRTDPPQQRPEDWKARLMPDTDNFPLTRVFCLIGTNPEDYGAAHGLSSKAVGAKSDGLVQIENAYVPGANNAFVHRSHSGRYGLVNSEEGYQNLRRFLFGDVKVTADLTGLRLPQPAGDDSAMVWQAEVQVSIRGLPVLMHEQTAAHYCPIQLVAHPENDPADRPVPLVQSFLWTQQQPTDAGSTRYVLHVRILSLRERGGIFGFGDHLEQTADFDDTLVIDLVPRGQGYAAWAQWNSLISGPIRNYQPTGEPLGDENPEKGVWEARVPLPPVALEFFGERAAVALTVRPRG